jgi:hypothetical protein
MRVVCIDNKGLEKYLTISKNYDVIKVHNNGDYHIMRNDGEMYWFYPKYFKLLSEIRTEKINKLLGL